MSSFGLTKQLPVFPFLISGILWKIGDAEHRSLYLSHAKRALYHLSYIPVEETGSYCLIKPFLCYWNSWTESSTAYRSNIGFNDAGHQSICFSHANRLPSRLTCLAGGVQKSCLWQWDVFASLISIVIFPSTSFWGKPWRFGPLIAFLASSVLFEMLPFHIGRTNPCLLFVQQNSLPFFLFWFPGSSEDMVMRGSDPRTSRMLSEHSTIWATSPLRKRGAIALSNLSSVIEIVEQSPLLHIVLILALSMRVINPYVSLMPIACPPDWHASLVGSKEGVYVSGMSLIHSSV